MIKYITKKVSKLQRRSFLYTLVRTRFYSAGEVILILTGVVAYMTGNYIVGVILWSLCSLIALVNGRLDVETMDYGRRIYTIFNDFYMLCD